MDDKSKQASSFQIDQEILDARGIPMTVAEVAGLSTTRYSERVQSLQLGDDDLAFLKGLRRRIKNRLASQNSRRRSMENLRRLARELRAVRECKGDAEGERATLLRTRAELLAQCRALQRHLQQILQERSDPTEIPSIDLPSSRFAKLAKKVPVRRAKTSPLWDQGDQTRDQIGDQTRDQIRDQTGDQTVKKEVFECRIDKLVQQSVNHIYKADGGAKRVTAKTVFITDQTCFSEVDIHSRQSLEGDFKDAFTESAEGVLNLSVKQNGGRRSHGRKQSAPRRCAVAFSEYDDSVLDLKIKKETQ